MGFKEVVSTKTSELSPYDNVENGKDKKNSSLKNQDGQQQPVSPNTQRSSARQQPPNSPKQQQNTESSPRQPQPWPSLFQNQNPKFSSHSSPQVFAKYQHKALPGQHNQNQAPHGQHNQHQALPNQHSIKADQCGSQPTPIHHQKESPQNLQPMPSSHNQSESPKYITDQHISEVHVTMKSRQENKQDSNTTNQLRLRDDHCKANSLTTTNHSLSPLSRQKFSGLNPTTIAEATTEQRTPSSPSISKKQRDLVKSWEMSTEDKKKMKRRLLQEFPDQDPLVLELTLISNNHNEVATRVLLKKWEENTLNKEEQEICADKLERPELYKSFKTFPPAAGSSNRQSHNALDQHGTEYSNNDPNLRSRKISMKTLLVTSQVGSSVGGWMSQLPGVTCCLRSFKSSTYRGLTTKVITHDTIHHSFHQTEPQGPNPALQKGPNKSLLRQDCVKASGPNVENRHGPNPHNRGDRILAMGPNHDLVQGPVCGGSARPAVVNSL